MSEEQDIQRVGIIGAGVMGWGIAQVCVQSGFEVCLQDVAPDRLEGARAEVASRLDRLVAKGKMSQEARDRALGSLQTVARLEDLGALWVVNTSHRAAVRSFVNNVFGHHT